MVVIEASQFESIKEIEINKTFIHPGNEFRDICKFKNLEKLSFYVRTGGLTETLYDKIQYLKFRTAVQPSIVKNGLNYPYLKVLDLSGNQINDLKKGIFDNLVSIEEMDLSRNWIHILEEHLFLKCKSLKFIDLSQNQIENIEKDCFFGTASLKKLFLTVGDQSGYRLHKLPRIKKMHRTHQNRKNFDWENILQNLNGVEELSTNYIFIKKDALMNHNSLKKLEIGVDNIDCINKIKHYYKNLEELKFSYNLRKYDEAKNSFTIDIRGG